MTEPEWKSFLPPTTRPGSRTVLCDPDGPELAIELARRGYRLLLLHDGGFPMPELRQRLREHGLQSQLMGSHACLEGRLPSLASDFYELWLCGGPPRWLEEAQRSLQPGALVLWKTGCSAPQLPQGMEPVDGLPAGVQGARLRGSGP